MILSFFYIKSIFFFLAIFILQVNAETKIIAKKGDTLFKISKQYGVSLKELMHKNNFNDANITVEGEVIIIPLKTNDENKSLTYKVIDNDNNDLLSHKVIEGDTLYKIARDYNVEIKDIIKINNLEGTTLLRLNQIVLLPKGAIYKKELTQKNIKLATKKVFYHQTLKGEQLSSIAEIHKITAEQIITLNNLNDPIKINTNTKLKIRKNKVVKWLRYGPLTINWSDWRYSDGNYITNAKSKRNRPFYLALNCERRVLNHSLNSSDWPSWYFPERDFEFKIINDFCDRDFKF